MLIGPIVDGCIYTFIGVTGIIVARQRLVASKAAEKDGKKKDVWAHWILLFSIIMLCRGIYNFGCAFSP